jgi:Uma2 family endonuclease
MTAALKLPDFLTVDAFLAWDPPPGQRWQLVDGTPQAMAPPNTTHALIQSEVARLLGNHLLDRPGGCAVMSNPGVVPRVNRDTNIRIPDLGVTCTPPQRNQAAMADPVLLIEILSPSNRAETWSNVWAYTTIPSVHEILLLHTQAIGADLLRRHPDGTWPERPLPIPAGERLTLESIGFETAIEAPYRGTWLAAPAAG